MNVQLLGLWSDLTIDSGKFDEITATIDKADDNTHIIIDNGASGFVPFLGYLLENETVDYWKNIGIDVIFHTIVTGGQARMKATAATAITTYNMPCVLLQPRIARLSSLLLRTILKQLSTM